MEVVENQLKFLFYFPLFLGDKNYEAKKLTIQALMAHSPASVLFFPISLLPA